MRLDVYLKVSRLIKRRSVAKEMCDSGRVLVGGLPAKPGRLIKAGDVITLRSPRRTVTAEVIELPRGNVPKERAAELYRVIEESLVKEEFF